MYVTKQQQKHQKQKQTDRLSLETGVVVFLNLERCLLRVLLPWSSSLWQGSAFRKKAEKYRRARKKIDLRREPSGSLEREMVAPSILPVLRLPLGSLRAPLLYSSFRQSGAWSQSMPQWRNLSALMTLWAAILLWELKGINLDFWETNHLPLP